MNKYESPSLERFHNWAYEYARARDPDNGYYKDNKRLVNRIDAYPLGNSAPGIDHAWIVGGYPLWGPSAREFEQTEVEGNEAVIITAPYGEMPTFDPTEIHVEPCPVHYYGHDSKAYIVAVRDLRPRTEAWLWFKKALGCVGNLPVDTLSTLMPGDSKYGLVLDNSNNLLLVSLREAWGDLGWERDRAEWLEREKRS